MSELEKIITTLEPGMDETQLYSGQVKTRRVTRLVLRYWRSNSLPATRGSENRSAIKFFINDLHKTVKRQYGGSKFNPIILIFLGPVITYCINMLLDWWFSSLEMQNKVKAAIEEEMKQAEP